MKYTILLIVFIVFSVNLNSQTIRKSGTQYVGTSYSLLKYGQEFSLFYENYFRKGFSYIIKGGYEESKVNLTSYDSYALSIGANKSLTLPVKGLYFNLPISMYVGRQLLDNEYFDNKEYTVLGTYIGPNVEYFMLNKLSLSIGATGYLDFKSEFRDMHYSYNFTLKYLF